MLFLNHKKLTLKPQQFLGKGGEAEVYRLNRQQAVKLFKSPDHADYRGQVQEQQAARNRIAVHQQKLPLFPGNLPERVVVPMDWVRDDRQQIVGYTMRLLTGVEPLLRFCDRNFRQSIPHQRVVQIFQDLHDTVSKLHFAGVVIGDFNDLNVLVRGTEAFLIDADSFQFEPFTCGMFTARFVDPLLCDPQANQPLLQRPHTEQSDWYAFTVMLMQSLLFVDPFGGVYKPKDASQRVPQAARSLHRITVFHPEVKYPKPALPYDRLPDELLHYFQSVFERDQRGEFPRSLLDNLHWTTCSTCGTEHARSHCPVCAQSQPGAVVSVTIVRGQVTATRVLQTEGLIQFATVAAGQLQWVLWRQGQFQREDGSIITTGDLQPNLRWRIQGDKTLIGQAGQVMMLQSGQVVQRLAVDSYGAIAQFEALPAHTRSTQSLSSGASEVAATWLQQGQLLRMSSLGSVVMGTVLPERTQIWCGSTFGFGFYQAGDLTVAFVFDLDRPGLNDRVQLPTWRGQLIAANCAFSSDYGWLFLLTQTQGQLQRHCMVIRRDGQVIGSAIAIDSTQPDHWLMQVGQSAIAQDPCPFCPVAHFLLIATDDGIIRIEVHNGQLIQTRTFPDTEPFVDASTQLLPAPDGLYAVRAHDVQHLKMS